MATVSVSERLDNNKEEGFFLVIIINFYKGFNELLRFLVIFFSTFCSVMMIQYGGVQGPQRKPKV